MFLDVLCHHRRKIFIYIFIKTKKSSIRIIFLRSVLPAPALRFLFTVSFVTVSKFRSYAPRLFSSLSENIQTVISIKDRNQGQLLLQEGVLRELDFQLDHFPEGYDKEAISRGLAPLKHIQQLKSSIPDSVTFLEMYQAETF